MADELELGRSTTHRYAGTLVELGYLEQGPSRKYRLSFRVSNLGLAVLDSMTIRRVACEHLRNLRDGTGGTVSLGVLGHENVLCAEDILCIDRWPGFRRGQYELEAGLGGLGARQPIYCTAAGKALLAYLPDAQQRKVIARLSLTRRGAKTITTKTALCAELERIAMAGVAVEDEELLAGRRALATAVVNKNEGWPVAAVELIVPAAAFTRERLVEQIRPKIVMTAQRIAAALADSRAD
jgi:DNA-binding IclR family transcriptional regulator